MLTKSIIKFGKTIKYYVKGIPLDNKNSNKIKNIDKQEINIVGSNFFILWEKIGLLLHIIAFVLGISALVSEVESNNYASGLEIATVVIVGIIIFNHYLRSGISRYLIKSVLSNF